MRSFVLPVAGPLCGMSIEIAGIAVYVMFVGASKNCWPFKVTRVNGANRRV